MLTPKTYYSSVIQSIPLSFKVSAQLKNSSIATRDEMRGDLVNFGDTTGAQVFEHPWVQLCFYLESTREHLPGIVPHTHRTPSIFPGRPLQSPPL